MAKKPLVYVVTTNLNWDPRWAKGDTDEERLAWQKSQGKSEFKAPTMTEFMQWTQVRDIIVPSSKEALAMYNTLEKEVQQHRPGRTIVPFIELFYSYPLDAAHIMVKRGGSLSMISGLGNERTLPRYESLRDAILMKSERDREYLREQRAAGMRHVDLVVNYVSNHGYFDALIARLDGDFSVKCIEVMKKRGEEI